MIERILGDREGRELIALHRQTREQVLAVKREGLPDLVPIGGVEEVPGTGQKVFIGERRPRAGQLVVTLGTWGRTHDDAFALQRELVGLADQIGTYTRTPGGTLEIAGVSSVRRSFQGSPQSGGEVELTLECTSPYFWTDVAPRPLVVGAPQAVRIGGQAPTGLRVSLTAGGAAVTNPSILSDAGLTIWRSTVPAGQTLTLDSRRGWSATLNGADVSLYVTGPLPHLEPGTRSLTLTAPGAAAEVAWREGDL
ncbi:hypothetical protein L1280_002779 [Deinococcus sp. HSC-46F16]|uniref:phage tail family protein n=1 Tax=Deinococcus sp. HSC-46F16 TaxID=2910968 RepID=UPI0020A01AF3|nr:phage tail family protein [Deinococcus sp. HSC-46F16]MCP2015611.1 hypothetical protein [Deinococcus sp. HSC-46F16]